MKYPWTEDPSVLTGYILKVTSPVRPLGLLWQSTGDRVSDLSTAEISRGPEARNPDQQGASTVRFVGRLSSPCILTQQKAGERALGLL